MTDENNQVEDLYIDSRHKDVVITLPKTPQKMHIESTGKEDAEIQDCFGHHIATIGIGERITCIPKSQHWLKRIMRRLFGISDWHVIICGSN